jgi:hypothetical protein
VWRTQLATQQKHHVPHLRPHLLLLPPHPAPPLLLLLLLLLL